MASINYAAKEISVKIVYYGPGLSGKTTNLQVIHRKTPAESRSDMVSLATETDRTLFFDFLPIDLGTIKGFNTKFQLYTVPGQVYYNATRKLVLRGVDGLVFVADSSADKMPENMESFQNLEDNLAEYGYKRENIPIVLQYNKRDMPNALPVEELDRVFNKYHLPWNEAIASKGRGVFESLKMIGKIVIDNLNKKYNTSSVGSPLAARSAVPVQPRPQAQPAASPPQQWGAAPPPQQMARPQVPPMQAAAQQQPRPPAHAVPPPPPAQDPFVIDFAPTGMAAPQPPRPQAAAPQPGYPQQRAPAPDAGGYGNIAFEPTQQAPAGQPQRAPQQGGEFAQDFGQYQPGAGQQSVPPAARPTQPMPTFQPQQQPQQQYYAPQPQQQPYPQQQPQQQYYAPQPQQQPYPQQQPQQQYYAPQPQQQPYPQQQPQQQYYAPQPQQPQQQPAAPGQDEYPTFDVAQQAQAGAQQSTEGGDVFDDTMYFTSVNTDRPRKKVKRPVNPKTVQNKGLLGKLFGGKP